MTMINRNLFINLLMKISRKEKNKKVLFLVVLYIQYLY